MASYIQIFTYSNEKTESSWSFLNSSGLNSIVPNKIPKTGIIRDIEKRENATDNILNIKFNIIKFLYGFMNGIIFKKSDITTNITHTLIIIVYLDCAVFQKSKNI